jgi:enamine deaminase RidA (YjgF/YER057c/UK114 family)
MTTTTGPSTVRINPTAWSSTYRYDQGQLRSDPIQILTVAGQGSVDEQGRLLHEGDIAAQIALAVANLADVIATAGMTFADVAQLRIYVTDIEAALDAYEAVIERLDEAAAAPPATLVEVTALRIPGMAVAIDAIAIR